MFSTYILSQLEISFFCVLNRQIFEFENPSPVCQKRIVSVIKYKGGYLNG